MKRLAMFAVSVLTVFVFLSGMAVAQDKPDATLELEQGQIGIGIGFSWGEGVLTFQGKKHAFKVEGLSVIDVGITKATAKGSVYGLKKLEDFNGNFTSVTAEGTLGGGAGATKMKNQNGVVIDLITTTKGVNVKLAPSGVKLTLK
ncbi:MAG: DUF1134 domain-containing protein [Deltaproteobacteria bacterium]|nr:DUF1134 domain-containing protein [Deltaproteobacteria bacterium]